MSLSKTAGLLLASAALVASHGYVTSIDVDGTTYGGYLIDTYYYESDPPEIIAWSTTATDDGFVAPSAYDSSDIVCHRGSAPAALSAPVAPGGSVKMTWNTWPDDHHGPVITYLAKCDGDCADVDKTTLEFFKIDAGGLISETAIPGTWASDKLIEDSFSRTMTIPSDIEAGNYVLRHEIIALHSAENTDGAQNYPHDPGIFVDIWNTLSTYDIPGPTLYTAGGAATATAAAASSTSASTEAAAVETTTAAAATAAAVASVADSAPAGSTEAVSQVVAVASSTSTASTSASTSTSGVLSGSCSQEGYWYCNGGSAFQRCANGEWDASQSVAEGTQCTAGISEDLTISATVQRRQASHLRRHNARINRVY
ncbi:hypothetical protein N7509_007530 [Penicillium cosmopolitanum]|uniref:Auxiliary Activity family 9 catalytic domain-containing protein n=1 Tax=Penicillium cosmopolitanum TaxID=1131564 RepID=A0A9W9VZJ9_9EURO|nr:uncharacterized protein N7509_007530 [Penicillium cosmopolitanum]KAJ5392040.1 hypothetical protein N7509_007530 [Penicillium cosmopolitanum]